MKTFGRLMLVGCCLLAAAVVLAGLVGPRRADRQATAAPPEPSPLTPQRDDGFAAAIVRLDEAFRSDWRSAGVAPAPPAPPLAVARRLSLALVGAVPSLEEIRRFESWPEGERIDRHVDALLADRRAADYLAERLARALVGDENGPFLLYRRRRFVSWISDTLHTSSRYDQLVERVLTGEGLWTDNPEVNFVTATVDDATGQPDPELLAVRVSRVLLGIRLDCAQCHDHPFDERWKQTDFQALAAYFGGAGFGEEGAALRGVTDLADRYVVQDRETGEDRAVEPRPPFQPDLAPTQGKARRQLASWVTHAQNRSFARAAVNRFWALLVGRPLVEPIDDIPLDEPVPPALDVLADEFVRSGADWRELVRLIAASEAYRLDSRVESGSPTRRHERFSATFPLTRLRGEQVAGAIAQSARLTTIDGDSHILVQLARFAGQNDFLRRYGDAGAQEMEPAGGSLSQRLLMMNGEMVHEQIKPNLVINAATRIAALAPGDDAAIETAYLTVLTRRPTGPEREHFVGQLQGTRGDDRAQRLADVCWALFNSTEFSWNH